MQRMFQLSKVREEGELLGLERAGSLDGGWAFSEVFERGVTGLCRDGSLWECSLQFLPNYSSAGGQGQTCTPECVHNRGKTCTNTHLYKLETQVWAWAKDLNLFLGSPKVTLCCKCVHLGCTFGFLAVTGAVIRPDSAFREIYLNFSVLFIVLALHGAKLEIHILMHAIPISFNPLRNSTMSTLPGSRDITQLFCIHAQLAQHKPRTAFHVELFWESVITKEGLTLLLDSSAAANRLSPQASLASEPLVLLGSKRCFCMNLLSWLTAVLKANTSIYRCVI